MNVGRQAASLLRSVLTVLSPRWNTNVVYLMKKGTFMHWKDPRTFAEKLLKLKVECYNHSALVKRCADKYEVRSYVAERGCGELLNELYGIYDRPEEVDWDALPE